MKIVKDDGNATLRASLGEQQLLVMLADSKQQERGFRLLMRQYGEQLYWHIRRIVVGHDDAEDVLQETSIKIFNNIGNFKGEGSLLGWMYRIATNEALYFLRRQTHLFQSIDDLSVKLLGKLETETPADADAMQKVFQQALLTLPTQQRIAFNLRYYDELSYDEISRITGKNVGTLKTNYHYATEKIKEYIKQYAQ